MRKVFVRGVLLAAVLAFGAGAASAGCVVKPIAELPVIMAGTRPQIQAKINGADAVFLVDSGAYYSILSKATALRYGLALNAIPGDYEVEGVGGDAPVLLTTVQSFNLAGMKLRNVEFLVGGSEVGSGAVGALGLNIILNIDDTEFDLAGGAIRMFKLTDCGDVNLAYWSAGKPYSVVPLAHMTPTQPHIIGTATLNGMSMRVMFDTGASRSFVSREAAARAGIIVDSAGVKPNGRSGGIGRNTVKTWIAPVASFKIGDEEIRNTRLRIGDTDLLGVDMLLGADFFLSHRIYVSKQQRKMFFTYNGGPVFNLDAAPPPSHPAQAASPSTPPAVAAAAPASSEAPSDADGFSRRGAARAARGDVAGALADLERACALAPHEPRYFYQRGMVQLSMGNLPRALADLDQTLKLQPANLDALIARADLNLGRGDRAAAVADLDAADHIAAKEADERFEIAMGYERLDHLTAAAAQLDLWIATHHADHRLYEALAGRCWVEALQGDNIDKASADCDVAGHAYEVTGRALEGRGLIRLRRGDLAGAAADFTTALERDPKSAWALYGRGLAELRLGRKARGDADVAAATALQPEVAERAARHGLVGEAAGPKPGAAPR